jgi:hypothetical protein
VNRAARGLGDRRRGALRRGSSRAVTFLGWVRDEHGEPLISRATTLIRDCLPLRFVRSGWLNHD